MYTVRTRLWQIFLLCLGAFFWMLVWRSMGRGTVLATFGAGTLIAVLCGHYGRRLAITTLAMATAGLAAAIAMFPEQMLGTAGERMVSPDSPGRLYLWRITLDLIAENPWLGIGPMNFAAVDNTVAAHPHSAPLQWAVEWGIPAAVLMVGLCVWAGIRWLVFAYRETLADRPKDHQIWVTALTASLLAGAAHSLVSGIVVMPASQILLVLVGGLALGTWYRGQPAQPEPRETRWDRVLNHTMRAATIAAAIYLAGFTLTDYLHRQSHPEAIPASDHPRFWANGSLVHQAGDRAIQVPPYRRE